MRSSWKARSSSVPSDEVYEWRCKISRADGIAERPLSRKARMSVAISPARILRE